MKVTRVCWVSEVNIMPATLVSAFSFRRWFGQPLGTIANLGMV